MLERAMIRHFLLAPPSLRSSLLNHSARQTRMLQPVRNSSNLQSVTQPSFWTGLIPKPLRRGSGKTAKKPKSKEWNPATFFIISLLLIGSMSIQMIALRHDFSTFTRRADVRIELLKEIIERVQKGEEVDVEGLLETGNPQKELEWEEVMKEMEKEDDLWEEFQRKKEKRRAVTRNINPTEVDNRVSSEPSTKTTKDVSQPERPKIQSNAPRGFY